MHRSVGRRVMPGPALRPSAEQLRAAYAVNDPLPALLPGGRIAAPKGIYRFRSTAIRALPWMSTYWFLRAGKRPARASRASRAA